MRSLVTAVALLLLVSLSACSEAEPDRKSVAAAKCQLPVSERLGLVDDQRIYSLGVVVDDLGEGRFRVKGTATFDELDGTQKEVPYTCEVAPDGSDKLRGFRVTSIELDK